MNGFWGADTDALRTMGVILLRRANALADLEGALASSIDSLDWEGEDAEHFRAEWSRVVRAGLQDQAFELRLHARRLAHHADAQDEVSAPDGWTLGGWSTPGEFLQDVFRRAEGVLGDLLGGGAGGGPDGADGPLEALLRDVLSTPEGRAAFLGAFLGSAFGGLLADMVSRALGDGLALEDLLIGLGPAAGLSALLGASTQGPAALGGADAGAAAGAVGGAAGAGDADGGAASGGGAGADAGGGASSDEGSGGRSDAGSGGGSAGGAGGGSGSGAAGGSGGEGSGGASGGSGGASGGAEGAAPTADASAGSDGGAVASSSSGTQATAGGAAQSGAGSISSDRAGDEGPTSLLERLLEMLGDAMGHGGSDATSVSDSLGTGEGARR